MAFLDNNVYVGTQQGHDRIGHVTPDSDASDPFRPWLVVQHPAAWLAARRQDQGHPVLAGKVISAAQLVGLDASGALIPAGLFCGVQATKANGGQYCVIQYSGVDVNFATNPMTGLKVASAAEHVVLACPSDAAPNDTVTLPNGAVVTISAGDIAFAENCTLIPGGVATPVGYAIHDVYQYIGAINITNSATINSGSARGMVCTYNPMDPTGNVVHNTQYQAGVAVQTKWVLRVPWIGATPTTLAGYATSDGITGYVQTDYSRSFVHFTGAAGNTDGDLYLGAPVVASRAANGTDAGNFAPYNSAVNAPTEVIGRVIGIEALYPINDFVNRVRTQFERASSFLGPIADPNPASIQMGGSATRGMDYQVHLTTNGIFRLAYDQGTAIRPEYGTYVHINVLCR